MRFMQTKGGVHLHVRTCKPFFRISGTALRLKFGVCLMAMDQLATHFVHVTRGYYQRRNHVRTFRYLEIH